MGVLEQVIKMIANALRRRGRGTFRRAVAVLAMSGFLVVLPTEVRPPTLFEGPVFGVATAGAQSRGGGRGGGSASERSSRSDPDSGRGGGRDRSRPERDRPERDRPERDRPERDRPERDRPERDRPDRDRGATSRSASPTRDVERSVVTPESPAGQAIGRALGQRDRDPGTAPTEAGTARARAMVEIGKDLGAAASGRSEQPRISGAVTQEMLDAAEQRYVDAVQEAWEAHGFPWNDSDVLDRLNELDALVSALESIMQDPDGVMGTRVATDFNDDGYVDINDLWDAHRR